MTRFRNNIQRLFLIILLASNGYTTGFAQSLTVDDYRYRWEGDVAFGFNTDGGQFDFGAYYFLNDYVGFNLRLGMSMDPDCTADFITDAILPDEVEIEYNYDTNFYARLKAIPALTFRTQRLIYWRQLDAGFHLFCNPGVIFATAADFNSHADYVAWDVKTGINFQYDRLIVSLAYELTNLTLYSGLSFEKYTRNNGNYLTHAGMLSIGYKF